MASISQLQTAVQQEKEVTKATQLELQNAKTQVETLTRDNTKLQQQLAEAQDFSITTSTNHGYADGNEIITIKTSQIKDSQGNTITDGTLVTFSIQDDLCTYWQVQATTVNGFAFAKALHPQIPTSWRINASIIGIAQSEEILQSFEPILETIPVTITADRMIVVGPLTSYLGQLVPEGIDVSLTIGDKVFKEHTKNGKVTFAIKEGIYPKGDYLLKIETLGLEHKRLIKLD